MANNRSRRRRSRLPENPVEANITALSNEGRGIAHVDGRTIFIDQALVGEKVLFKYTRVTSKISEGRTVDVLESSDQRVDAACAAFEMCGGCSLQHMSSTAQIELKQSMLLDQLKHLDVMPAEVLPPLLGPEYGYRHKARLGVRYVHKKGKVLVGFRERNASYITETQRCEVLHPSVGTIIAELAECLDGLETRQSVPQIEVAVGDDQTVLVFRHLEAMPQDDRTRLADFCQQHGLVCYLQAGKPDALELLYPATADPLYYALPNQGLRIEFQPSDFTQVNPQINRKMVSNAIDYLDLKATDTVLDLFSGLGNFSLAMAKQCARVTAVEGSLVMVQKARDNAVLNGVENAEFVYADLYSDDVQAAPWMKQAYNKILLDPPRSGAAEILPALKKMQAKKIVYVSCHPATLARDAATLVHELGYRITKAGIMDMFPHTGHVESIAVFEKQQ